MKTFEQWLNRPVYKVQVHTAKIARSILNLPAGDLATCPNHPIMLLRLMPAHRCSHSLALRKKIADIVRQSRKAGAYQLKEIRPYAL